MLFDLDDTLIAFEHGLDLDRCWQIACSNHLQLNPIELDELIARIKSEARWYWSDPDRHRIGRLDLDKARTAIIGAAFDKINPPGASLLAAERIAIDYGSARNHAITLHPDAIELLVHLRSLGIKLALLTNGSASGQRDKINRFKLAPYFDCILIEEEFGHGKPHHSIYQHALKQLDVRPDETWMVGDNYEWEIVAPQQLGIRGIWVNPSGEARHDAHDKPAPFRTIQAVSELRAILEEETAMECAWYHLNEIDTNQIKYVVIIAEYNNQLIIIRNKSRELWELPGGKKELHEDLIQAASRELYEETGAIRFELNPFSIYMMNGSYGMMFYAKVNELADLPDYEIAEIQFLDTLPDNLLYGHIYYEMYTQWMIMREHNLKSIQVDYSTLVDKV
nr:HAD-IA family hydrolase [Paenibacillus sp. OV219]